MPMLFIAPQSLIGQFVYTTSGTLETQQVNPIGLDGATMSLQLEFDNPDVWGQPPLHAIEGEIFNGLSSLERLFLGGNLINTIESTSFSGLDELRALNLSANPLTIIEDGAFGHSPLLQAVSLDQNRALTKLNLAEARLANLNFFFALDGNDAIHGVSLNNAELTQSSLVTLMEGRCRPEIPPTCTPVTGIGELSGITELELSGVDFVNITDLSPLHAMDDVTDLWLVGTENMDAFQLDVLLDELDAMQSVSVEGVLFMTQVDYDALNAAGGGLLEAWHNEQGHHVTIIAEPTGLVWGAIVVMLAAICRWESHYAPRIKQV